jgi:hypothetical protein
MANESALRTTRPGSVDKDDPDIIWGMVEIGQLIGKTPKEIGYLLAKTDLLDGCVKRISHKVTIGSRRRLRELAETTLSRG